MKRPSNGGSITTPAAKTVQKLLGKYTHASVAVSPGELRSMRKLYEIANVPKDDPVFELANEAAILDTFRNAECDGVRIIAWLARNCPPGEDPLKTVIQLAGEAGWDVSAEDLEYSESYKDEE